MVRNTDKGKEGLIVCSIVILFVFILQQIQKTKGEKSELGLSPMINRLEQRAEGARKALRSLH